MQTIALTLKPVLIALAFLAPVTLIILFIIARELRLTNAIDPEDKDDQSHLDAMDFDEEVEALMAQRRNSTKN